MENGTMIGGPPAGGPGRRRRLRGGPPGLRGQRGAHALEFAWAFLFLFLLFYLVLTYSLIFTAQQVMNLAAQEGARAALRWQPGAGGLADNHEQRREAAWREIQRRLQVWPGLVDSTEFTAQVCAAGQTCAETGGERIAFELRYPYRTVPLLPLPGPQWLTSAVLPDQLVARGTAYLRFFVP